MATHSQVDGGFIERFICHFIENVVAQRSPGSRGVKIEVHVSSLIVFFPQSLNPTQQSHTTSNLSLLDAHTHQVGDEPIDQFISDQWLGAGGWSRGRVSHLMCRPPLQNSFARSIGC